MHGLFSRARSLWPGIHHPEELAAEMDEEMRFHIDMEAARLVREKGLGPQEVLRKAAIAFGGLEERKEEGRDARGLSWLVGLSLDLKLAWGMLKKSRGLTAVGLLGIALGVAVGKDNTLLSS